MDFNLTPQQEMIRTVVREFAEKELAPIAAEIDESSEFPLETFRKFGAMGLQGMPFPRKYGGAGTDYLSYIIANEEISKVCASSAMIQAGNVSLTSYPIYQFGTEEQKQKYLVPLAKGEKLGAFALTEPNAGTDAGNQQTTAVLDGDQYVINGVKTFISNAEVAETYIVSAMTDKSKGLKGVSLFIVEKGTPGFTSRAMHGKMMWRASDTAEMFFDECRVPFENMLGKRGEGSKIMLSTLDNGRLSIAAMGLGCAQGAYEMALAYSKERKQFGHSISKFQAIAFKLADMATKIELARTLLYKACWLKDNHLPFAKEAAMSKLYCSEIAKEVTDEAVQIHGGYGLMKDYDIERFYRDQRLLQIGEGTSEIQRLVISRHIGC